MRQPALLSLLSLHPQVHLVFTPVDPSQHVSSSHSSPESKLPPLSHLLGTGVPQRSYSSHWGVGEGDLGKGPCRPWSRYSLFGQEIQCHIEGRERTLSIRILLSLQIPYSIRRRARVGPKDCGGASLVEAKAFLQMWLELKVCVP